MNDTAETDRMTVSNRRSRARLFRLTGFGLLGVLALGLVTLAASAFLLDGTLEGFDSNFPLRFLIDLVEYPGDFDHRDRSRIGFHDGGARGVD